MVGAPWQWAAESYAITRQPAVRYCVIVGSNCQFSATQVKFASGGTPRRETIGAPYISAFKSVAEERVRRAGLRLAHLINQALDPGYVEPIRNSGQPG